MQQTSLPHQVGLNLNPKQAGFWTVMFLFSQWQKQMLFISDTKPPKVISCPLDFTVQAIGKNTPVSWQPPDFTEPYGFDLSISTLYPNNTADLSWGVTNIIITATSLNNQTKAVCSFQVTVNRKIKSSTIFVYLKLV